MATNVNKKNKKSEEKTRYTRDDDNITLEIDEEEVNNLLYSPDSEPEAFHSSSSPSNNTEVGREESTALTHCDEKMDLTTPLDDSSKVDGSGDEKVDGLLAASSLEESSAAPTGVGSKCMLSGQRGDEKVDGLLAASRLEESSSAPALVETQGKNSGTSPPVTMAQVMALLQAHGGKLLGQLSDHNRRLVALEDPSPGVDAGTQTTNPARKLKRKLSNETKQNINTYRERKEAGIARDGSLPSDLYKMGFRSYKGLKALVQKKTAKEVLAQLGYPLDLLQQLGYTQLLDLYAVIWLVMWANGGVNGIDSNLDEVFFSCNPTVEQADRLLSWVCPAIHQWLANQPAASRQEFHHPSQDKLKYDGLEVTAVKHSPPAPKKARKPEPSSTTIEPRGPKTPPSKQKDVSREAGPSSAFPCNDVRDDLEAQKRVKRVEEIISAFSNDRIRELNWHARDTQHLKDWLRKLLRDACLGEIRASRLNDIIRTIVKECAAASANAASSSKLKGNGKKSRK